MEENLNELIRLFYEDKEQLDYYKKETEKENKEIKEIMSKLDKDEFETDLGLKAKITIQKRESFNEPKLIDYLKQNDFSDAIDLVEVINYDKLEDMIYNGKLNASNIADFKETKEVVTLKVTQLK